MRLRRRSAVGFSGPQPIGWQDIDAFVRRSGVWLRPFEIEWIEALDDIFLRPERKPVPPQGQGANATALASDAAGVKSILGAVGKRRVVKRTKGGDHSHRDRRTRA